MSVIMSDEKRSEIFSYIEKSVEDENFIEYQIEYTIRGSNVIWGYKHSRDLLINANITGKNQYGHELTLNLFLKLSDKSKTKNTAIRKAYRREMYLFKDIFNALTTFIRKKRDNLKFIPTWYKLYSTEDREVIIFNSLRSIGFVGIENELFPTQPEKYKVLNCLSRLHSASFAFRDQNPQEFEDLTKKWSTGIEEWFMHPCTEKKLKNGLNVAFDIIKEAGRPDLKEKLEKEVKDGVLNVIHKIYSDVPEEHTIIHGDARMDHVMFMCDKENGTDPKKIKFIYWQLSTLHSPVLDLAYFLYFTYMQESSDDFEHYVEYYYMEFSNHLTKFGSDPQTLFPFNKLLDHFLRYAHYPLIMALSGIPLILVENCNKETCDSEICENNKKSLVYEYLSDDIKTVLKDKILGIVELHYKYFTK